MASWRSVRTGCQFVNVDMLRGGKTITDKFKVVKPADYKGKPQLVGYLERTDLAVNLNTTSCKLLETKWGEEFESWVGKQVKISLGKSKFGGSQVDAIIVTPVK